MCNDCIEKYFPYQSNKSMYSNKQCIWFRAMNKLTEFPQGNQEKLPQEPYTRLVWHDETFVSDHPLQQQYWQWVQRNHFLEKFGHLLPPNHPSFLDHNTVQHDIYQSLPTYLFTTIQYIPHFTHFFNSANLNMVQPQRLHQLEQHQIEFLNHIADIHVQQEALRMSLETNDGVNLPDNEQMNTDEPIPEPVPPKVPRKYLKIPNSHLTDNDCCTKEGPIIVMSQEPYEGYIWNQTQKCFIDYDPKSEDQDERLDIDNLFLKNIEKVQLIEESEELKQKHNNRGAPIEVLTIENKENQEPLIVSNNKQKKKGKFSLSKRKFHKKQWEIATKSFGQKCDNQEVAETGFKTDDWPQLGSRRPGSLKNLSNCPKEDHQPELMNSKKTKSSPFKRRKKKANPSLEENNALRRIGSSELDNCKVKYFSTSFNRMKPELTSKDVADIKEIYQSPGILRSIDNIDETNSTTKTNIEETHSASNYFPDFVPIQSTCSSKEEIKTRREQKETAADEMISPNKSDTSILTSISSSSFNSKSDSSPSQHSCESKIRLQDLASVVEQYSSSENMEEAVDQRRVSQVKGLNSKAVLSCLKGEPKQKFEEDQKGTKDSRSFLNQATFISEKKQNEETSKSSDIPLEEERNACRNNDAVDVFLRPDDTPTKSGKHEKSVSVESQIQGKTKEVSRKGRNVRKESSNSFKNCQRVLLSCIIEQFRSTIKYTQNVECENSVNLDATTVKEVVNPSTTFKKTYKNDDPISKCCLRLGTGCKWRGDPETALTHIKSAHSSLLFTSSNQKMFILQFTKKKYKKYYYLFNVFENLFRFSYEIDSANNKVTFGTYYLKNIQNFGEYCFEIVVLRKTMKYIRLKAPCLYMANDSETFLENSFVCLPHNIVSSCVDGSDSQGHLHFILKIHKN